MAPGEWSPTCIEHRLDECLDRGSPRCVFDATRAAGKLDVSYHPLTRSPRMLGLAPQNAHCARSGPGLDGFSSLVSVPVALEARSLARRDPRTSRLNHRGGVSPGCSEDSFHVLLAPR